MEILIVGAGKMARGIGLRAVRGGHRVRIAAREPDKAAKLATELGPSATGEPLDTVGDPDMVVLATPYQASRELARLWADQLAGKTLVDICNPVAPSFDDMATPEGMSAAQEIAGAAPEAFVVKAFNTTFATRLANSGELDVFIAGDEPDACAKVALLCDDGELRALQVGGLKHAAALEAFQLLHMRLQDQIEGNWSTALTIEP